MNTGKAVEAVLKAIHKAREYLRSPQASREVVGPGSYGDVTRRFDQAAEEIIIRQLASILGSIRVVSEESGATGQGDWTAVIDPVDGSANYAAGIPYAAISIALAKTRPGTTVSDIQVAAVAEVFRDNTYLYVKGQGFKALGAQARRRPAPAPVILGYFETPQAYRPYLAYLKARGPVKLRSMGSAALDIVLVGLGAAEGFIDARAKLRNVDVAAAVKIAEALGAKAHLCNGTPASSISIHRLEKIGCLVAGYSQAIAGRLLQAAAALHRRDSQGL